MRFSSLIKPNKIKFTSINCIYYKIITINKWYEIVGLKTMWLSLSKYNFNKSDLNSKKGFWSPPVT